MTAIVCPECSINLLNGECPSCHRKLLNPPEPHGPWTKEDIDQWWEEEMKKLEDKK